jgi:hypothetical protein
MTPKIYHGANGKDYVLDEEGHAVREATEKESKEAEKREWSELWDGFGEGLDDD